MDTCFHSSTSVGLASNFALISSSIKRSDWKMERFSYMNLPFGGHCVIRCWLGLMRLKEESWRLSQQLHCNNEPWLGHFGKFYQVEEEEKGSKSRTPSPSSTPHRAAKANAQLGQRVMSPSGVKSGNSWSRACAIMADGPLRLAGSTLSVKGRLPAAWPQQWYGESFAACCQHIVVAFHGIERQANP